MRQIKKNIIRSHTHTNHKSHIQEYKQMWMMCDQKRVHKIYHHSDYIRCRNKPKPNKTEQNRKMVIENNNHQHNKIIKRCAILSVSSIYLCEAYSVHSHSALAAAAVIITIYLYKFGDNDLISMHTKSTTKTSDPT